LKEAVASWLVVTGVLLVILLTNQVAKVLQRAAENQYPQSVVLQLIGLGALQNLSVLMPIGLLLGVVLAFGRLYHDSEMAAATACGVGPARIFFPISLLAVSVTVLLSYLTMSVAPAAITRTLTVRNAAMQAGQFAPVAPGKFRTFGGGDAVVYAEGAEPDGTLTNVFVERNQKGRVEVALAAKAKHEVTPDGMTHTITLYDGERFEGTPGSAEFRIVRFAEHLVPVQVPELSDSATRVESTPTSELFKSKDLDKRAELHWRLAMPIQAVVLTLLAVPLSKLRPRQGRFARVWIAILIYFFYVNTLSAGKVWLERGRVPEQFGLWWAHAAVVGVALVVIFAPGWFARLRHKDRK
jgi:lipopolysaccharide export system permease protein